MVFAGRCESQDDEEGQLAEMGSSKKNTIRIVGETGAKYRRESQVNRNETKLEKKQRYEEVRKGGKLWVKGK